MTPRNALLATACLALPLALTACSKEEEPPPPPPRPIDFGPDWTLNDIDIDPRVQFPERFAPSSKDVAQGIADLAGALINGDASGMRSNLDPMSTGALDILVSENLWDDATEEGRIVRVVNVLEEEGLTLVALGWEGPDGAFPIAFSTGDSEGAIAFAPYAIETRRESRAAALDGIPFLPPEFVSGMGGPVGGTTTGSGGSGGPGSDAPPPPPPGGGTPSGPGFR